MEYLNKPNDDRFINNDSANVGNLMYYGVYVPSDQSEESKIKPNVFQDITEVLQLIKQHKKARFKSFTFFHEAEDFAINGAEYPNNNATVNGPLSHKSSLDSPNLYGEKPSPFKGPKPQELVLLRKSIERGEYVTVKETIWYNPRYLISNGDTPSILQEGSRYNALHIAAKSKNYAITELILTTISNPAFVKLLYGDDNHENAVERGKMFLDLYLNTPDKGFNETPLHFAVKYGAVDVVEVLVSYPECDKQLKNKFGQAPDAIICSRCDKSDVDTRNYIKQLLEESYYVPVLRADDNSMPPIIGEPFSPTNPPVFRAHPSSPRVEIQAYAGPMNKEGAEQFRKVWKTPPRSLNMSISSSEKNNFDESFDKIASLKYKDPLKGLEILGKTLANKYDVSWKEYWPFLDSFVDITSKEGLDLLETHLSSRFPIINTELNFSRASQHSSISDLCHALDGFSFNSSGSFQEPEANNGISFSSFLCLERACDVFANRISNDIKFCTNELLGNTLYNEMKQLEIMTISYMDDDRFHKINFNCIHFRVANLVVHKLGIFYKNETAHLKDLKKLTYLVDLFSKSIDCFSSDDEENFKETPLRRQLVCLLNFISNAFSETTEAHKSISTEQDCLKVWKHLKPCSCILSSKRPRKSLSICRTNMKKYSPYQYKFEHSARRLSFDDDSLDSINDEECAEDDVFYTPPSSPCLLMDVDDEEFDDALTSSHYSAFIDGCLPSKTDYSVHNAIMYSGSKIDEKIYPNIYLWKHNVNLYSESERRSWRSPSRFTSPLQSPILTSTPQKEVTRGSSVSSRSWLRITGANSPINKSQRLNKKTSNCIL